MPGNPLHSKWVCGRGALPIVLGLAICSRPIFFLIAPVYFKLLGWRKAGLAMGVACALAAFSVYLGWSPAHIRPQYADVTAITMLVLSSLVAVSTMTRKHLLLCTAAILTLPAMWVSNAAYHCLLAAPFYVWAWESE